MLVIQSESMLGGEKDRIEAVEVVLVPSDGLTAEELSDRSRNLVQPLPHYYEEERGRAVWGATGAEHQALTFLVHVAEGLTAAGVVAGFTALVHRGASAKEGDDCPTATTEVGAWSVFSDFLGRAFLVAALRLVEITAIDDGWNITATSASGSRLEGSVTTDGRIRQARRVGAVGRA